MSNRGAAKGPGSRRELPGRSIRDDVLSLEEEKRRRRERREAMPHTDQDDYYNGWDEDDDDRPLTPGLAELFDDLEEDDDE